MAVKKANKKKKSVRLVTGNETAPKSKVLKSAFTMPLLSTALLQTQVEAAMLDVMKTEYSFSNLKAKRRLNKFRAEGTVSQVMQTVIENWFALAG